MLTTVLVVDDEQDMRNLIEVMLSKSGFKTVCCRKWHRCLL